VGPGDIAASVVACRKTPVEYDTSAIRSCVWALPLGVDFTEKLATTKGAIGSRAKSTKGRA
jgi:hypothetical protein